MSTLPWPSPFTAAASLTFDFDAEAGWVGSDPENARRPGVLSIGHYGARVGLPLILDTLKAHQVRATFFIVGQNVERYPRLIARVIAEGHEVAIHGYTHISPQELGPEAEEWELTKTRDLLTAAGGTVTGYRSPSWDLSPVTLDLLDKHGLLYSSQMMADIRPYRHGRNKVIELPIQWLLDDWPHFAFARGDMDRPIRTTGEVETLWLEELEGIVRLGGHFILTMHPQVMGRPARVALLERLIVALKARPEIWLATCDEVARHAERTLPPDDTVTMWA
jgi:peptidoglycan/xylan/chitin deacetylase (PgdA/CDA1 family)